MPIASKPLPTLGSEHLPARIGRTSVTVSDQASIIGPATGFMADYDVTLNPYVGCGFGCTYCYAASFAPPAFRSRTWGEWVHVKRQAVQQLRERSIAGRKAYLGSVTDPYQPLESKTLLVRSMLSVLSRPGRQPRLVIQTRSPLVTRDIDILLRFEHIRVNMSVTTDSDAVRKRYEPTCPSIERRLDAIQEVAEAGVPVGICLTPLLPVEDAAAFGRRLAAMNAAVYVAQPFKPDASGRGWMAAGTRDGAIALASAEGWGPAQYRGAVEEIGAALPHLYEGRAGFMPA
jgi:DNA repair photolyase